MTGFLRDADDGKLVLATRHGIVMQVFWKQVKREVAVDHRLVQLVSANKQPAPEDREVRRRIREIEGWQVYFPDEPDVPVFAARYLADAKVVLHLVFPTHPDTSSRGVIRQVLVSFKPNNGDERVWAAFGIDVVVPRELQLFDTRPLPAMQEMEFEDRRHVLTVRRIGMMPEILEGGDVPAFVARLKGKRIPLRRIGGFTRAAGEEGDLLTYRTRGRDDSIISNLLDRTWEGHIYVWRRDDLKRLFIVEDHAPAKYLLDRPADRMTCR